MDFNKGKVFIGIGLFLLILTTSFNVYMYLNKDKITDRDEKKIDKEIELYKEELKGKESENEGLRKGIHKEIRETDENKVVNSTMRFLEFIYDNDAENYVIRKKDASNYMGDGMIERFFPSDNVIENNEKVELSNIEVYIKRDLKNENEETVQVIAVYDLKLSIEENTHAESDTAYMKVTLKERDGKFRVIELEEFNSEGSVDYE